jgi:hypothetical protein
VPAIRIRKHCYPVQEICVPKSRPSSTGYSPTEK